MPMCICVWGEGESLSASLPGKTLPDKMQLPFFCSFAVVMPEWEADKNEAFGHQ